MLPWQSKALQWHKRYFVRKTIAGNMKDQIVYLEADVKNKDEMISSLKRHVKSDLSIDFDYKMPELIQQISNLGLKLKDSQTHCESLEFIMGDRFQALIYRLLALLPLFPNLCGLLPLLPRNSPKCSPSS